MSTHTAQTQLQLVGKLILSGDLHCETGLHIGAGKGSLEIGGADNPVVKDAFGLPYIPGSSLRGKVRSLLENALGLTSPAELVYLSKRKGQEVRIHQSDRPDDEICLLFGRSPGRMERVRRRGAGIALGQSGAADHLRRAARSGEHHARRCARISTTRSPRSRARTRSIGSLRRRIRGRWSACPPGARFRVRMVLDVLCEEDKALAARVIEGLRLLEDDALGGGGSRGSGRVRFANLKTVWRNRAFYSSGGAEAELASGADLAAVQALANDGAFAEKLAARITCRLVCSSASAHRAVAHRPGFGRPRPRGPDLSQRLAVLGGFERDGASGQLEEWLDATARAPEPAVRFSSCFPFHGETLYVVPPRQLWPPPASAKVRWKGARFVPLSVVDGLVNGSPIVRRGLDGGRRERDV